MLTQTVILKVEKSVNHANEIQPNLYTVIVDGEELPKVKGADDALRAKWIPIADLKSEETFEDHAEIIQHFVGA